MYRVSLAFVQLFSLYVQWFDLAIIEPVIVCFSSDVYSFSGCICISEMLRYQFQHSTMQRRRHHSRYCPAVLKRETSDFLQRSAYWGVFLWRMTVQELAVITNLVLFSITCDAEQVTSHVRFHSERMIYN
jgi:hypothetical protein